MNYRTLGRSGLSVSSLCLGAMMFGDRTTEADSVEIIAAARDAGINFIDTYHRSGLYKRDLPFIGGQEGGGKIAAVTPKVCRCKVNVWVCTRAGTHKRSVQPWRMLPPG